MKRRIPLSWTGVQSPPESIATVLSNELALALKLDQVYPVSIDDKPPAGWKIGAACLRGMPPGEQIRFYRSQSARWHPDWIRRTYVHELAHVIAVQTEPDWAQEGGHCTPFAILFAILLRRSNAVIPTGEFGHWDEVMSLSVYDVSSVPAEQQGLAVQTALNVSQDLASRPISIEECGELIWADWWHRHKYR